MEENNKRLEALEASSAEMVLIARQRNDILTRPADKKFVTIFICPFHR